jgi:hypothetical protein
VTFENNEGRTWTMVLNSITGTIDFVKNEDTSFEDFDG